MSRTWFFHQSFLNSASHTSLRDGIDASFAIDAALAAGDAHLPIMQAEVRHHLRDVKLICFSQTYENLLMWSHYAGQHTGAVLRLTCIPERDNVWGAAQPVRYQRAMPRLLDEAGLIRFFSGEVGLEPDHVLDLIVLTKSADWEYKREWRIPFHFTDVTKDYEFVAFRQPAVAPVLGAL